MSIPRVSVILAAYNCQAYIRQAVESVLEQEYRDLELLVVDDGSSDGTREILERCAASDPRVVLLLNETNRGIVFSRNRALERARGEFLAGQDADDISLPLRLKWQVEYFDSNPGVGVLGTWVKFMDEHGGIMPGPGMTPDVDNAILQGQLLDRSLFCPPTVMVRKTCLDIVGRYDPRLPYSHDYDLLLRLSEVTSIANLAEPLYLYRQHQTSVTSRHRPLQMYYKAQALHFAVSRRWGNEGPAHARDLLTRDYLRASYLACKRNELDLAQRAYADARGVATAFSESGSLLEDTISRYTAQDSASSHLDALETFFGDVCEATAHTRRVRARLMSSVCVRALREALDAGLMEEFDGLLSKALRLRPRTLFNRNVMAMIRKRMLRPWSARPVVGRS